MATSPRERRPRKPLKPSETDRLRQELEEIEADLHLIGDPSASSAARTFSHRLAFVLDERGLRWLHETLNTLSEPAHYQIFFKDGSSLTCDNLDDVLLLPNAADQSIVQLIASVPGSYSRDVNVTLQGETRFETVKYRLGSRVQDGDRLAYRLDQWIGTIRPWYSRIATVDFFLLLFALPILAYVAIFIWASMQLITEVWSQGLSAPRPPSERTNLSAIIEMAFVSLWFLPLVLGWPLNRLRTHFFPVAVFAVGFGENRHRRLVALHYFVFITVAVATIVGLLVNWVSQAFR